ncbi:flagellar filament capping protein FliD [Cupriavidus malaysiensis]|uniref:Flagellar hook-associated protein 2 n=1 Tax=Cupriavidus malaysiensis TaxID=367825 RepID=A0ABM6FEB2_9BURK|nr:flagellar filament capping protein FliD [Cupriavidus malaysiensis]AOZ10205.1 flagellar hook protein [Cupriavidus malaysiensis]
MTTTSSTSSSSSPLITSLGVGSGLDLSTLLTQLTTAAQTPLTQIKNQETAYQTKLSAYGQLQSMLTAFQTTAQQLSKPSFFNSTTATSSNAGTVGATSSTSAVAGSYAVNVTQLAQSQSLVSTGQASQTASTMTGTIHINLGTISDPNNTLSNGVYGNGTTFAAKSGSSGVDITIDSSNNTLQGIAGAINKANAGVTASIINDGSGTPYRLVLTSNATGANSSMQITTSNESGSGASLSSLLGYDPTGGSAQNMQQVVAGQNAKMTVNNIAIQSASNSVTDAIQGVTLSLSQTGASTVAVKQDTKTIETGVQSFVTAYNNLQSTITSLSAYDASTKTAQPLTGDSTLQVLQQQLRSVLNAAQSGSGSGANAIKTLAQAGVTFQKDGTLSFDSTTLDSALSSNPNGVAALFANTNGVSGYGNQINSLVTSMTGTNGALTAATNGINQTLTSLSSQYTALQGTINAQIQNYQTEFSHLDVLMSQMQNTSSYLTQQFNAMTKSSSTSG